MEPGHRLVSVPMWQSHGLVCCRITDHMSDMKISIGCISLNAITLRLSQTTEHMKISIGRILLNAVALLQNNQAHENLNRVHILNTVVLSQNNQAYCKRGNLMGFRVIGGLWVRNLPQKWGFHKFLKILFSQCY